MKMNLTCVGAVGGLMVAGVASGGAFQSLTMTTYTGVRAGAPTNSVTYRLFANVEAGAQVNAAFGNSVGDLEIGTTNGATIYHNANGGPTSTSINNSFFPFVPSMEWDSYVSIGALYQNGSPFGSNDLFDVGIDFSTWEGGGDLFSDNGSWFAATDTAQSAEVGGQVFLGQFTVVGGLGDANDLIGQVNLQGEDASGNTWQEIGATWNTGSGGSSGGTGGSSAVPGIGAIAPLCFVGLVRKRRRQG